MNTTEAVKTKEDINTVSHLLRKYGGELYSDIWNVGINVSLRISDLLNIKFSDLDIEKRFLQLKEQKTGKYKEIRLNQKVIDVIESGVSNNIPFKVIEEYLISLKKTFRPLTV